MAQDVRGNLIPDTTVPMVQPGVINPVTIPAAPVASPVAPTAPIVATPTAPPPTTPFIASSVVPAPTASQVYGAANVQAVSTKSPKSLNSMKIGKLEKELAKANSIAEMNQIGIGNQTLATGVISGQQAHQSKLDTAKLNALTGMYNVKLEDLKRKETERQNFITQYGADPNARPKGMSKKEFSKAIAGGGFKDLLTEDFKKKQLETAKAKQTLAGGIGTATEKTGAVIAEAQTNLINSKGTDGFVDPGVYLKYRSNYATKTGNVSGFDDQFGSMLSPEERTRLGVTIKAAAAGGMQGLSTAVKDEIATMDTASQLAGQITSQENMPGIGAYGYGTLSSLAYQNPILSKMGLASSQGETNRNLVGNIKATIAKMRGGTSFTPNEEALLNQYTPTINDNEAVIRTKLKGLQDFISLKKHNTLLANGVSDPTWGENDVNEILNSK